MDVPAHDEAPVGHLPSKQSEFNDKMPSISTSTPVYDRSKPVSSLYGKDNSGSISEKPKHSNCMDNDSGYADSTFLSEHEHSGHMSSKTIFHETPISRSRRPTIFHETPISRSRRPSADLDLCSPISLCGIDCSSRVSKQSHNTSPLLNIPEDEFCTDFKEMSMYSFDFGSECGKSDSGVSSCGSAEKVFSGNAEKVFRNISPGETKRFDKFLKHFSPKEPDRLIGRKIGLKHVDIVTELHARSIRTNLILSFLEPADLCRMCQVSRQWQEICRGSPSMNRRRLDFLKRNSDPVTRFTGKENFVKKLTDRQHRGLTNPSVKLGCVQAVELQPKPSPFVNTQLTQDSSFVQAAQMLKNDERLCHCPKCNFASKVVPVEERGTCFRCSYNFCVNCHTEYHQARPCVPVACKKAKTDNVGGKKSKRNLKRL